MVKKYFSKTCLSINVVLESGKSRHISFSPLTGGGSVYYTDDTVLQKALAQHRQFGKLFSEDLKEDPEEEAVEPVEPEAQDDTVEVSGIEEAKDYLSERFGVSRTKMRGEAAVKQIAQKYGVEFSGI